MNNGHSPKVFVSYTTNTGAPSIILLDREQVIAVVGMMDQPKSEQQQTARRIGNVLDKLQKQYDHMLWRNCGVTVELTSRTGVVHTAPKLVPARTLEFAFYALMATNDTAARLLKTELEGFLCGNLTKIKAEKLYHKEVIDFGRPLL